MIFLLKSIDFLLVLAYTILVLHRGVEQLAARRAHNPKVEGSSPSPATKNFIRVARDCRLLFFTKNGYIKNIGHLMGTNLYKKVFGKP